jgi:hypothetical protein
LAKVAGPLLSLTAAGQFGSTLVFHANGVVSAHVQPRDAKSQAQMMERAIMGDISKECHQMSWYARARVRYALGLPRVKFDRNWIAGITQFLMINDNDQFDAGYNAWLALDSEQRAEWAMYDPGRNLKLSSGGVFFSVATGCYNLCWKDAGIGVIPQPMETNALEVSQAWNQ